MKIKKKLDILKIILIKIAKKLMEMKLKKKKEKKKKKKEILIKLKNKTIKKH